MKSKIILADDNIHRLLFKLSLPATVGMIVMALYNVVDTIFVGRGVGTLGIAGISIVFPFQMFVMAVGQMIGIGGASLISRNLGANNFQRAEKTLDNILLIVIITSLVLIVPSYLFMNTLLKTFGASAPIMPYAKDYLQIILAGTQFFIFLISFNNVIRAEGRAKIAMGTMIVSAILNTILDPIFIFGLKLGIRGAAIATVISQLISVIYVIYFFQSGKSILKFRKLRFNVSIQKEIFAVGFSSFSRQVAASFLVIILNNSLAFYGSDISIAVFGIINRILRFIIMPIFGIAQGLQPIVGYNFGAKQFQKVIKAIKLAFIYGVAISTLGFIVLILFSKPIIGIFTDDTNLIKESIVSLRLIILAFPVVGFQVVGATIFQALGKPLPSLVLSLARQILFLIPLILILPLFLNLNGIWLSFPISDLFATIITFITLFYQKKKIMASSLNK